MWNIGLSLIKLLQRHIRHFDALHYSFIAKKIPEVISSWGQAIRNYKSRAEDCYAFTRTNICLLYTSDAADE